MQEERTDSSADLQITAVKSVPIGYTALFDLLLNCYEKLCQYSHFQSDISPARFVLFPAWCHVRASTHLPFSLNSAFHKGKEGEKRGREEGER